LQHILDKRAFGTLALISALMVALTVALFGQAPSSDLMALYLAGHEFAAGHLDRIYPSARALFDLSAPDGWDSLAGQQGLGGMRLYPFIYPPLWAAAMAPLGRAIAPQTLFLLASLVNPVLMTLSAALAWRIMRPALPLARWLLAGLAIALISPIGFIALFQNQPQIVVSFLILLALERDRANAPKSAGVALALAASIKLYPVLFIVIWLARRNWPALGAFALAGAALALASLALGGPALTRAFLDQIATISRTVLVTQITFNLASLLGQFQSGTLHPLAPSASGTTALVAGVFAAKTAVGGIVVKLATLAGLLFFWMRARRADKGALYRALWPALLIFISLTSPLSWAYHYLSAVFLFPALLLHPRPLWQRGIAALALVLISLPAMIFFARLPVPFMLAQVLGTLAMGVLALLFLLPTGAVRSPQGESMT